MCLPWFFFFKQKTAYEMRISDWSSDVCSSDLTRFASGPPPHGFAAGGSSAPNHQIPDFAHIFHREPDALTPEPAVLHPAIGHIEIGRASCRERVCQYV